MRVLHFLIWAGPLLIFNARGQQLPLPEPRTKIVDPLKEGRAVVNAVLAQHPLENARIHGLLKCRSSDGDLAEIPVQLQVLTNSSGWKEIYQSRATTQLPAQRLTVSHSFSGPNRYDLAVGNADGSFSPAKPLRGDELFQSFAGTDFWRADLGLEFLHWPEQRLVQKEYKRTRWSYVIDSLNPAPQAASYRRVRFWIDSESGGIINAEAFDRSNRLLKIFSANDFKKVGGRWEVKELEIRNARTGSRTRLELESDREK